MILSENKGRAGYPTFHTALKHSWYNLFKKTKESVVRKWIPIKSSKCDWPDTAERILGVYDVDSCGDLVALYEDVMINILPKVLKKCGCKSCTDCMCGDIQDTIVQTDVIINGVTRANKVVTRVSNGSIIQEYHTWTPVYKGNSVLTGVQEVVSRETKCAVELSGCGCIVNNEDNAKKILACGCVIESCAPAIRKEYKALDSQFGYYKNDDNNKIIHFFNTNGGKTNLLQAMVVYQSNGRDMIVPDYCVMALMALLNYVKMMFSPSYNRFDRDEAKRMANVQKKDMIRFLNPIPFEHFVQLGEDRVKTPYYLKPHSDFVTTATPACNQNGLSGTGSATGQTIVQNINNTSYVTATGSNWLKVSVDEGNLDSPVSGIATYQNELLKNIGSKNNDKVELILDKIDMYNWGLTPDFSVNKITGIITFLNGYLLQPGSTLKIDLNQ